MADVTINGLTSRAPTTNDVFPFSTAGVTPSTYKSSLAQIKTALGLSTVASTGSYTDLIDTPTIPAAQIQSDWNQSVNTSLDFIKNKPSVGSNASGNRTIQSGGSPAGGVDGDIFYIY